MRHNFEHELPLIDELRLVAERTSLLFHDVPIDEPALFIAISLVDRIKERSISFIPLLKVFHQTDTLFGVGLLLRNLSSDMLLTIHLHHLLFNQDHEKLHSDSVAVLNEGKRFTKKYYTILQKYAPSEELKVRFQEEINKLGPKYSGKSPFSILEDIFKLEANHIEDKFKKILTHQAADTFMLFSKLEHFGIESQKLIFWSNKEQSNTILDRIYISMPQQLALLHDIIIMYRPIPEVAIRSKESIAFRDKMGKLWDEFQTNKQ